MEALACLLTRHSRTTLAMFRLRMSVEILRLGTIYHPKVPTRGSVQLGEREALAEYAPHTRCDGKSVRGDDA